MQSIVNRQARAQYEFLQSRDAGLVLTGAEVKSIKRGHMNLQGSYVGFDNGLLHLKNAHISAYQAGNQPGYDPMRPRKLLLQKKEIASLHGYLEQKGLTLIPEKVYSKHGLLKVTIVLGRGLKKADKRVRIKKRETDREMRHAMKYRSTT